MSEPVVSVPLEGGDRVVLYGLSAPERGALARLHRSGRRRWLARPPQGQAEDAFVTVGLESESLIATTFQGRRLRVSLETGLATDLDVVK